MSAPLANPDVLVIGAGPVGLTLAAELLRHGVRARIVDMNETPSIWSKAAVVHARTLEVMESMGCAGAALARGRKVHALAFYSGDKRIGQVAVDSLDSPYPFMLGLSQRETELLLQEHLASLGGRVERRVELLSFTQNASGVAARLAHGDDHCEELEAPWLVGCDGAHSLVRKTLGVPFEGSTYEEAILQADVRIRFPFPAADDEGMFFASPHGAMGALPLLGEGRYRLLALLAAGETYDPTLESFRLLMAQRGPAGAVVEDPVWMATFRFHHRMAPRYRVGRVFLAGDAAHVHSPVGGQGMNIGMQDAFNLAFKLALVIRGKGRPALLDSYQAERAPVAAATLGMTDAATRIAARAMGLKSPLAQRLRDEVFSLSGRLPMIEERAAALLGGLVLDYRASPIVAQHVDPVLSGPSPGLPALLDRLSFDHGPGPGQRAGDVELSPPFEGKARLFELLHGAEHTLLLFEGRGGTDRLARIRDAALARYGDVLRAHLVTLAGDPGGALHSRFGARAECLYLVRPDGYVGYRSQPADEGRLMAYLDRVFV